MSFDVSFMSFRVAIGCLLEFVVLGEAGEPFFDGGCGVDGGLGTDCLHGWCMVAEESFLDGGSFGGFHHGHVDVEA